MLLKNIFNIRKVASPNVQDALHPYSPRKLNLIVYGKICDFSYTIKRILNILFIISILSYLFVFFLKTDVNASYSSKFSNYPGYEELLKELQTAHQNWEFEILETGLDWSQVIKAESVARHGRNVTHIHDGVWNCQVSGCKDKQYEKGWYCASEATVAYYMDPRNSLFDDYIFQFEQLTYDKNIQTREGVEAILADCNYMQGKISYYDAAGKKQSIDKTYIDVIMEAAQTYNISPYHIASRIRQEQGTGNGTTMITGTWTGKDEDGNSYKGLYNYYNWGAFGSNITLNGLKTAKSNGWTNPEKAIKGGASKIANGYINCGQDTLYLQKFDVVDGGDGYYGHQYMTNVSATKSEGEEIRQAYRDLGMTTKESKMKFKIPVYKNMPKERAVMPGMEKIVTQDVQINADGVNVRSGKSTDSSVIDTLNKNTILVRIELDSAKDKDGNYWDKVTLSNGKNGYVVRTYLTGLSLQSNCNDKYIVVDYTNFRNGPGTSGTTVIKLLSPGQILTVVEKGKYPSLNGESWYRVKLSDGSYGYLGTGYDSSKPTIKPYDEESMTYDRVKVVCTDGLNIRSSPDANANNVLKTVVEGTILTRIQKNASSNGGFIWDKVTTANGIVGYAVRQDKTTGKPWIEEYKGSDNTTSEIKGTGFKTDGTNLLCQPKITVANIKKSASDAVIKNGSTIVSDSSNVGTGYTITSKEKTYTIIVRGDSNGDAKISSADYVRIKNHMLNKVTLTEAQKKAADANGDGKVSSADYVRIKNYMLDKASISV